MTPDLFDHKHTALTFVMSKPDVFRPDFSAWLNENWHCYVEFERRALLLRQRGVDHFGARCIWEAMRYQSAIKELSGEFKLNDHRPPCLARLFMMMNERCAGFFETRISPLSDRGAA